LITTAIPGTSGLFNKDTPGLGTGLVGAPECGDVMKLQIKVNLDTGVIEDAKFKTFGCGSAIASSSLATEWLKGKSRRRPEDQEHGYRERARRRRSRSTARSWPRMRSRRRSATSGEAGRAASGHGPVPK
jgi:hypothetical protein